jgi:hypothetical protein
MARSIAVTPKKRGRPATGRDPLLTFRAPEALIDEIDYWATSHEVPRSEALRKLIEDGLRCHDMANRRKRR